MISKAVKWLVFSTLGVYLITTLHHLYGAWIYQTPWRNHIAILGLLYLIGSWVLLGIYVKWKQTVAAYLFLLVSALFFVGAIGIYEGFYNHILKNILYFTGLPLSDWLALYYPPLYERPNDWLFEISGILTFAMASFCAWTMILFVQKEKLMGEVSKKKRLGFGGGIVLMCILGFLLWQQTKDPFGGVFMLICSLFIASCLLMLGLAAREMFRKKQWLTRICGALSGFAVIGLLCASLIFAFQPQAFLGGPKELNLKDWEEELEEFSQLIKSRHVAINELIEPDTFELKMDQLKAKLPSLQSYQIRAELVKLVGSLDVSHSQVQVFQPALGFTAFPLALYYFDDGIFLTDATGSMKQMIGAELIKIDDTPIQEVSQKFRKIIAAESESMFRYLLPIYLLIPELLANEKLIDQPSTASFTFRKSDGSLTSENLQAVPMYKWGFWFMNLFHPSRLERSPVRFQLRPKHYSYEYFAEHQSLYVQYNVCENESGESLQAFSQRLKVFTEEQEVNKLILDLRNNTGGNNAINRSLLDFIYANPELLEYGKLMVLTSGKTASAAVNLLTSLRNTAPAMLIGESPAHGYNMLGDPRHYRLSHSGIQLSLSSRKWNGGWQKDRSRDIQVDKSIPYYSRHFFSDQDTVLEYALNFQAKDTQTPCQEAWTGQYLLSPYQLLEITKLDKGLFLEIHDFSHKALFLSNSHIGGRSLFYVRSPLYCQEDSIYSTDNPDLSLEKHDAKIVLNWSGSKVELSALPEDYIFPLEQIAKGDWKELDSLLLKYRDRCPPHLEVLVNGLAYQLMAEDDDERARYLFELNIRLFPHSSNVYDSYAELLLKNGKRTEAKKYFQKALDLNQANMRIKGILEKL